MKSNHLGAFHRHFENNLRKKLHGLGVTIAVAANDNGGRMPAIIIRDITTAGRWGCATTSSIEVLLEILGLPWQCERLIAEIYEAVGPEIIQLEDLLVVMMEVEVLTTQTIVSAVKKQARLRYIIEAK